MGKLRERWARIPRAFRAISNIALILLLLYLCWCSNGKPLYNDMLEYRRMEKMQMLGPGTIVHELNPHYGVEDYPADHYSEYEHTIVSETHEGIIFFGVNTYSDGDKNYTMTYQEKTGDISLAVPPTNWFDWGSQNWEIYMPVYVFHDYPNAHHAELDLTIEGTWDIHYGSDYIREHHFEDYVRSYSLKSQYRTEDFFLFSIFVEDIFEKSMAIEPLLKNNPERVWETMQGPDGDAPQLLSRLCNGGIFANDKGGAVEADIRLYDEANNLIAEKALTIRTPEEEAHAQQEVQHNEN